MKKIMTKEEIIATTKQVVAEKKAEKEAKAKKPAQEVVKKAVEQNPAKEVKPSKAEEKAEKKVKKPSKKATKAVEEKSEKPAKENKVKVVVKSFKAFKALTDEKKVRVILEWSENDKVHFQTCFGKPLPKQKGSYYEVTKPILVESNNVLLWSDKLKVTHLLLNCDFKDQSLNGIPFTIEVVEG